MSAALHGPASGHLSEVSDYDITTLILSEHEVFRRDFAGLDGREGEDLAQAWLALADQLEVHAAGEEEMFYPHVVREAQDGVDETLDAISDHNHIRESVRAVADHETGSDAWWQAVRTAQEVNAEHMAEEERDVLPHFREAVDSERRGELGMSWLQFHDEHERAAGLDGAGKDPQDYVEEQAAP